MSSLPPHSLLINKSTKMKLSLLLLLGLLSVGLVASHAALPSQLYSTTPLLSSISPLLNPSGSVHPPLRDRDMSTQLLVWRESCDPPSDGVSVFFLEEELKAGHRIKIDLTSRSHVQRPFLRREVAKSIPFSSSKFDDILKTFNIKPESHDAQIMKKTLKDCEEPPMRGEEKLCATSLESMVDFAFWKIGNNAEALSTETSSGKKQEYTVAPGVKKVTDSKVVACHTVEYPYAVNYCHTLENTKAYTVPLEGADGTRVKAVAVCHMDTSDWNPKNMAFEILKVKPGTVPVCHFVPPKGQLVWVAKRLHEML